MLNPFFLQGSKGEQGLIQDLINEHLKIYGVDVYYLPRRYITTNTVVEEVIQSEFTSAFPIEAYVDSYEGYGNQGTILSKFGIQELDDLNLIISKERWESYISVLIKDIPNIELSSRPKEGDLIYFPFGNRLFEIKYVEHEKPFYQLKKNYVYELRCELFRYEDEVINTGIDFIDDPTGYGGGTDGDGGNDPISDVSPFGNMMSLQLVGIGSTASAITSIVNGGIRYIEVTNRGTGYKSTPKVGISSAPIGGVTGVGIATMISGIVDLCEADDQLLRVQGVELTNPGSGYTVAPKVTFIGGEGSGASAVAYIGNGIVGIITVTNSGSGYLYPPTVTFVGVSSIPASATSVINNSGQVTSIRITNAGLGYTQIPTIQIGSPNTITGVGTFIYNEVVVGSASSVQARVRSWNTNTKVLEIYSISGSFVKGETIVGQQSNASYTIRSINTNNQIDKFAQNSDIETESDSILDFSESNPFGNP